MDDIIYGLIQIVFTDLRMIRLRKTKVQSCRIRLTESNYLNFCAQAYAYLFRQIFCSRGPAYCKIIKLPRHCLKLTIR